MSEKHILAPWDWAGAEFITVGPRDMLGFVEYIVLEKDTFKRKYLPERTCTVESRPSAWGGVTHHCSCCCADLGCDTRNKQRYCPNCGARVVDDD